MTDFERFAEALAKTESNDCELSWGDPKHPDGLSYSEHTGTRTAFRGRDFMAMGRWQIHPAWYHDWVPLKVPVEASWDDMFREALENFWNNAVGTAQGPLEIAMRFHLGASAVRGGGWDENYAKRFAGFWAAEIEKS